jgi:mannan endo-1,4-beta-mannosidase
VIAVCSLGCSTAAGSDGSEPDATRDAEAPDVAEPDRDARPITEASTDSRTISTDADATPGSGISKALAAKKKLLDFFDAISGKQTLAGIHNRHNATPSQFTGQMHDITGKYPAFWSGDFLFEADDIAHRQTMIDQAKIEWSHGAVVQLMFHACAPDASEPCNWDPGLLHHPLSDAQWRDLITDGGALNRAWKARLDELVPFFQQLQDAGIAPLFRPHHEMNQGAFWWGGRTGKDGTRRLFQITHDYLAIEKKLDGIVWVWDVQDLSWDFAEYDPGEAYYDLAALDVYGGDGFTQAKYDALVKASPHRPIAIGECQKLPSATELIAQPKWTFFMGWSELIAENNSTDAITALFTASNVLTLDEMPAH